MRRNQRIDAPERDEINELMGRFEETLSELEELQCCLSEAMETYIDDTEDLFAQTDDYLDSAADEHKVNGMLFRELNAARREILRLLSCLKDNGLCPPEGRYIHYSRLNPGLYIQNPEDPFYEQDPDLQYQALLKGQVEAYIAFEAVTPMTTVERDALREHLISGTTLTPGEKNRWNVFLEKYRAGSYTAEKTPTGILPFNGTNRA